MNIFLLRLLFLTHTFFILTPPLHFFILFLMLLNYVLLCVYGLEFLRVFAVSKLKSDVQVTLVLSFRVISDVCGSVILDKTTLTKYCLTVLLSGFQSSPVPGKFHGFCGHCEQNCLQDRANFHRSWALQIVLIFNTAFDIYHEKRHLDCHDTNLIKTWYCHIYIVMCNVYDMIIDIQ